MFDREFLTEQFQKSVVEAKLKDVLNEYGADIDVILLMQIMLDAMEAELSSGDVAAIYAYRLRKRLNG
jgi:hypothetical protein